MPDWLVSVIAAVGCFIISGACAVYLRRAYGRVRWSRSMQQIVTRHPNPTVFWAKVAVVVSGAILSLAMGVLLIAARGRHYFHPDIGASKTSLDQLQDVPDR